MPPKKAPRKLQGAAESADAGPPELTEAERLSFLNIPRPFKNPTYSRPLTKKLRSTKQILTAERERERQLRDKERSAGLENVPKKDIPTYLSIEAAPSLLPQKRYCDITGLEAPYTDPHTKLRYHDKSVYEHLKALQPGVDHAYLAIRGQHSVVK